MKRIVLVLTNGSHVIKAVAPTEAQARSLLLATELKGLCDDEIEGWCEEFDYTYSVERAED